MRVWRGALWEAGEVGKMRGRRGVMRGSIEGVDLKDLYYVLLGYETLLFSAWLLL